MPFTIHPDQKPSDDDKYWKRYVEKESYKAQSAAIDCHRHIENVRTARALGLR